MAVGEPSKRVKRDRRVLAGRHDDDDVRGVLRLADNHDARGALFPDGVHRTRPLLASLEDRDVKLHAFSFFSDDALELDDPGQTFGDGELLGPTAGQIELVPADVIGLAKALRKQTPFGEGEPFVNAAAGARGADDGELELSGLGGRDLKRGCGDTEGEEDAPDPRKDARRSSFNVFGGMRHQFSSVAFSPVIQTTADGSP